MSAMTEATTIDETAAQALGSGPGNREALGELLEHFADSLLGFFMLQMGDRAQAEDLVQEVFLRVIRSRTRFQPGRPFRPWLWTIAHNLARTARARRQTAPRVESLSDTRGGDDLSPGRQVAAPGPTPRQTLAERERLKRLRAAVAGLDQPHREVILLKFFQELPGREVAQILGISEGTVWSRTHRALQRLGTMLGGDSEGEGGNLP
jgi:RNA polymerase sigma-70 factor (ECF subfamily)